MVVCAVGIPLPLQYKTDKSTSTTEPYPCMDCPCGCKDAETCWRDCCCHTQQEKLAWARDKGVIPPAYVLAAAQAEASSQEKCCQKNTCCQGTALAKSCCSSAGCSGSTSRSAKAQPPCCDDDHGCPPTNEQYAEQKSPEKNPASSSLLMIDVLRCQGLTLSLSMLPPSVLPVRVVQLHLSPQVGTASVVDDPRADDALTLLDTPPPQFYA